MPSRAEIKATVQAESKAFKAGLSEESVLVFLKAGQSFTTLMNNFDRASEATPYLGLNERCFQLRLSVPRD